MKGKLTPRESFVLYGAWIVVTFALFALGLYWGKGQLTGLGQEITRQPVAPTASELPQPRVQTRLDLPRREAAPPVPDQQVPAPSSSSPVASPGREGQPPVTALSAGVSAPTEKSGVGAAAEGREAFSIQVGALKTEEEATKVILRLKSRGYTGILEKPLSRRDPFYRVRVGNYASRDEAARAETLLKDEGFLTFIKKIK